jgi:hypothetical protein
MTVADFMVSLRGRWLPQRGLHAASASVEGNGLWRRVSGPLVVVARGDLRPGTVDRGADGGRHRGRHGPGRRQSSLVILRLGTRLGRAVALTIALLALCGGAYPAVVFIPAHAAFPAQSHGTAPACLVIASAIFLGNESGKFASVGARLNELARGLREGAGGVRALGVQAQITRLHRRAQIIRQASRLIEWAMLTFVATIFVASLATALPNIPALQVTGAATLSLGLLLLLGAIALEMRENVLSKRELEEEIADLPLTGAQPARLAK